jgi:hypothetical protein
VSSLSASLLDSGRHALHEVKAGVRAGIGSIEAAALRAQQEAEREARRTAHRQYSRKNQNHRDEEEDEDEDAAEEDEENDEDAGLERKAGQKAASDSRRNNSRDLDDENEERRSAEYSDEDGEEEEGKAAGAAFSSSSTGPSSLSETELSIRRINFLRLLARCEALVKKHLHAPPGEVPPLLVRAGEPNPTAQAFFRNVALLQRELAEHFAPAPATRKHGKGVSKGGSASAALHPDARKDTELRRRVGFLATVAEKESSSSSMLSRFSPFAATAAASASFMQPLKPVPAWGEEEKKGTGLIKLARGSGLCLRARSAAAASSFATAGASTAALGALPSQSSSSRILAPRPSAHEALVAAANAAAAAAATSAGDDASSSVAGQQLYLQRAPPPPLDPAQEIRAQLFARSANYAAASSSSAAASSSLAASAAASAAADNREFQAELEQRALLAELHEMTESLKANALRLSSAMKSDARVLDTADELMDKNLAAIGAENARLKAWASAGCGEMCGNIVLILALWGVFIATFVFIKIFPAPKN